MRSEPLSATQRAERDALLAQHEHEHARRDGQPHQEGKKTCACERLCPSA